MICFSELFVSLPENSYLTETYMEQKRYGHFDDQHREYVITDPQTPWPWINYLGNEDFFSLISNTAGGYSFYKDAKFRRITRYRYNNVPMDNGGRYFYIKDGDTVWNPGWKPCKTPLDFYECRHGMSYTRITGKKNGVEASVLFFVPLKKWCEVQKLTLRNESSETKSLKLFSFEEWCLWNAATEVEIEGSTIYHKTEYRERRNHYAFYHVNALIQGFDTDRETFVGLYNEFANPDAVIEGKPRNSHAHGWSPIASHYIEVTLKPGESKDFVFLLGYIENEQDEKFEAPQVINKKKAHALIAELDTTEKVDKAFAELCALWDDLLNIYKVKTGNDKLDRMVNIWNQYQCMVTFNFSRSASVTVIRTSWASCIRFRHVPVSVSSTSLRHSSPTAVATTSISLSRSAVTMTSAVASTTIPAGSSSVRWLTSRRRVISRSSMRWCPSTTSPVQR